MPLLQVYYSLRYVEGYGYTMLRVRFVLQLYPFQIWSDDGGFWLYIDGVRFYIGLKGWDYVDDWWSGCG